MTIGLHFFIPHICHFFYTGRIFESQYFTPKNYEKHPKITTNCPKKCKICSFSRSIWKILHRTEFFYTGAACGACDKYEVCTFCWSHKYFLLPRTLSSHDIVAALRVAHELCPKNISQNVPEKYLFYMTHWHSCGLTCGLRIASPIDWHICVGVIYWCVASIPPR